MTAILSGNSKASMLAQSLWEFYNYQLYCTVRPDDGEPNRHRIDGITGAKTIDTIRIFISIRDNERQEEGLVHELLHANLIPLGYPRFWIDEDRSSEKWTLASGIINLADHIAMFPPYLSLGYSSDRFLGPSRPLNERETRIDGDLQALGERLKNPEDYSSCISEYLERNGIRFKQLQLTNAVTARRLAG